ncbi:hypothetical protein Tsubulata_011358, partial [Turnera subulata]
MYYILKEEGQQLGYIYLPPGEHVTIHSFISSEANFKQKELNIKDIEMASVESISNASMSYPMTSGDGPHSYYKNSNFQKRVLEAAKQKVKEAIEDKLEVNNLDFLGKSETFCVADFGCSVGPNTFSAMQNIVEAVQLKYEQQCHQQKNGSSLEFQVFFNDHVNNDFNTLFRNLPIPRGFFAAGVPGGFTNRLFPKASLHFAHSSYALHWLSKVPEGLADVNSPAYNKDSIHCTGFSEEVAKAYAAQFKKDMENFLNARGQELVGGGLMALTIPATPEGFVSSQTYLGLNNDLLLDCLMDMVKEGLITKDKVEAFNLPLYFPPIKELEAILHNCAYFTVERIDSLARHQNIWPVDPSLPSLLRAFTAEVFKQHFGEETVDPLFERFAKKLTRREMASQQESIPLSYPMTSGDGPHSYYRNSNYQRRIVEAAKQMVKEAIEDKLEFTNPDFLGKSETFCVADFGCSVGPNTFIAMQNIVEAVQLKYAQQSQRQNGSSLEFQVFFNDHVNNDFNTLFRNLPVPGGFFAAGVPSGFTNRLFPKASLHFAHSSYALHWLSKVPEEVADVNSPAYNRDSIHCTGFSEEVAKAFCCSGLINKEKVEAFNLPSYYPPIKELEALLERNPYFSVEKIDSNGRYQKIWPVDPSLPLVLRAFMGEVLRQHFGDEILDPLFHRFAEKLAVSYQTYAEKEEPLNTFIRRVVEVAKQKVKEAIEDKLEFTNPNFFGKSKTFCVADFGCSVGPNTFIAVQNIIEAVQLRYDEQSRHQKDSSLEFQVFFNDHVNNDFNTLFRNLPVPRGFFAAGVPGGFTNRLFPKASLHIAHSSYALHWLSKVPDQVTDVNSPAYNKDSIHCTGFSKEVTEAYSAQFRNDMDNFLNARAQELVGGGLMVLTMPTTPEGFVNSQTYLGLNNDLQEESLRDMVEEQGQISKEKVEAFNLPLYFPPIKELEALLERNAYFTVERIDAIGRHQNIWPVDPDLPALLRAYTEEVFRQHFGEEIVDSLFQRFAEKLLVNYETYAAKEEPLNTFIILKRKMNI